MRRSGRRFTHYAGLDDPVFDVNVTPNRQDCMGVRGIARDLAAAGMGTLKPLGVPQIEGAFPCPVPVKIEDPEGCPAFFGRAIRGLSNGPSPEWMQRRLKAAGQRPISALVDITNYVMLDHGRPAHAYDIAKLSGGLTARAAKAGREGARAQREGICARAVHDGDRRRRARFTTSAGSWAARIRASARRPPT